MRAPRSRLALAVPLVLAAFVAAPAQAATRYAAPAPAGTKDCSSAANACDIATAITAAQSHDEVILAPGDYGSPTPIDSPIVAGADHVFIHGALGAPPPRIHFGVAGYLHLTGPGDNANRLDLEGADTAIEVDNATATASNIVAHVSGPSAAVACVAYGGILDSLCWAEGTGTFAVDTAVSFNLSIHLRNVTAIATGDYATAFELEAAGHAHVTVLMTNTIAHATGSNDPLDVSVRADPGAQGTLTPDHSNFLTTEVDAGASVTPSSTNQTTAGQAPLFRDASAGDFHEASGSPTIDHGADSPSNGLVDFEGDPRTLNGTTDIGADEYAPPPTVLTGAATAVKATRATVAGSVNPQGVATRYRFAYGTTNFGHSTPFQETNGTTQPEPEKANLTGLLPGKRYRYRIEAVSSGGAGFGATRFFTTGDPFKGVVLHGGSVTVKKGKAPVKVTCPALTPSPCHGTLKLTYRKPKAKKTKRLGKATFTIATGKTATVRVKLSKAALGLLAKHPSLKAKARAVATDAAKRTRTTTGRVKLTQKSAAARR